MASLKDIRRRIASVKNTQQITKAMKLVAAAKLRRAQEAIASARPFAAKLEELTNRVLGEILEPAAGLDGERRDAFLAGLHPLLRNPAIGPGEKRKVALVVVASDRGLCGAYNTNILRYSMKRLRELKSDANNEVSLFFVGRRANDFFTKRGHAGHWFSETWTGRFTTTKADAVAKHLTEKFLEGEFHSVEVCFTQFKSALSQVVGTKKILPLVVDQTAVAAQAAPADHFVAPFIYEPKQRQLLGELLPKQVRTQFYRVLADSLASEFGARMTSMDNATRNAGKMISTLTLESNRVRQASITKELMEIVGGAEALKG